MNAKLSILTLLTAGILALPTAIPSSFGADTTTAATGTTTSSSASSVPANKLASEFSSFAGSTDNAKALVTGLRSGSSIMLTPGGAGGSSTTFTPPTKPMGFGNVNISLALAQASLTNLGITNPTPEQIKAALTGGSVTTSKTTTLPGILTLRSEGKGWGVIAKSLDLNLGKVVSGTKTEKSEKVAERAVKMGRPERVERPDKVERPGK